MPCSAMVPALRGCGAALAGMWEVGWSNQHKARRISESAGLDAATGACAGVAWMVGLYAFTLEVPEDVAA